MKILSSMANIEIGLNDMTADPLFLILSHAQPIDVLRVCQINKRFQLMCQNPVLFRALIRVHYPDAFEADTPKEQYKAITMGLETTYWIPIKKELNDDNGDVTRITLGDPVQQGKTKLPHHTPGFKVIAVRKKEREMLLAAGYIPKSLRHLVTDKQKEDYIQCGDFEVETDPEEIDELFKAGKLSGDLISRGKFQTVEPSGSTGLIMVPGYPIPCGTKAWFLIFETNGSLIDGLFFKTKQTLAQYILDRKYQKTFDTLISSFLHLDGKPSIELSLKYKDGNEDNFNKLIYSTEFAEYVRKRGPYPFTQDTFYNHISEHESVVVAVDSVRASSTPVLYETWFFKEVIFQEK